MIWTTRCHNQLTTTVFNFPPNFLINFQWHFHKTRKIHGHWKEFYMDDSANFKNVNKMNFLIYWIYLFIYLYYLFKVILFSLCYSSKQWKASKTRIQLRVKKTPILSRRNIIHQMPCGWLTVNPMQSVQPKLRINKNKNLETAASLGHMWQLRVLDTRNSVKLFLKVSS